MQIDDVLLQEANDLLAINQEEIENLETEEILSVGCTFCGLGCDGIVGG